LEGRQIEMGESDVDGNSALLFLRQSIAVDAGQSAQQGRFSVIDVTGRAKNQRAGVHLRMAT
jgi:hypothetical protein